MVARCDGLRRWLSESLAAILSFGVVGAGAFALFTAPFAIWGDLAASAVGWGAATGASLAVAVAVIVRVFAIFGDG